jgi:hypothetical protein
MYSGTFTYRAFMHCATMLNLVTVNVVVVNGITLSGAKCVGIFAKLFKIKFISNQIDG